MQTSIQDNTTILSFNQSW